MDLGEHYEEPAPVDLEALGRAAAEAYEHVRPVYESFASDLRDVIVDALEVAHVKVASVEARAKALESFRIKASKPSENDPSQPRYPDAMDQITDKTGVRIIVFFPKDLESVSAVLDQQLQIVERNDKGEELLAEERFGYQSIHFLVRMKENRTDLPEYSRFRGRVAEVQVRTVLQHAWAEIEHDIQYKSVETIPISIKRRFMSLAGLLEIADREFQAIQDSDTDLRLTARESVKTGALGDVEITADALKAYLDEKLGPDGRISSWSYEFMAKTLLQLGFTNLQQVDECTRPHDHDFLSRLLWGSRQGQLYRFEGQLLAGLGEPFIESHPFSELEWFRNTRKEQLDRLQSQGIVVGQYVFPSES